MVLSLSHIYYFDFGLFMRLIWQNLLHFSIRRLFLVIGFIVLFSFVQFFTLLLRLMDEVFYPAYRKKEIKKPVFIISNPRSGTTYLHSLFCLDEDRFTYFLLYHTFFPSVVFYKFILLLKRIDSKLNWVMRRFFEKVERKVFKGWEDIHPMGFERSEEDEGIFVLQMMSPAVGLFCPWFRNIEKTFVADELPEKKKAKMMNYYESTLKRFMYAWGKEKQFLAKNVISTGRIEMLLKTFPDARIIYPMRHPYQTIPSITSMFTAPWKLISPKLPENSPEFRSWGNMTIQFYLHFLKTLNSIPPDQIYIFHYKELLDNPYELMVKIYGFMGFEMDEQYAQKLLSVTGKSNSYNSKHNYSLEQYGFSKDEINQELSLIFEKFEFER